MTNLNQLSADYLRIEQAILYLENNSLSQPDLSDVSSHLGLSEYHFQRLFSRWAGISPKRFIQYLTKEKAKRLLIDFNVLDTTYRSGLSSPSRLHDLFVQCEAVTPGEYKSKGRGVKIIHGFHPTPFGECLIAITDRGICFFGFVQNGNHAALLADLRHDWVNASLSMNRSLTASTVAQIFSPIPGQPLTLHMRGTNFQIKVWEALLRLPPGMVTTYQLLAGMVGSQTATRAVGNALACNPIAFLIPCHRVLRKIGGFGRYRYGSARKKAILVWEMAQLDHA
jgi:AraC family transcriptional regulator, regulatory protein of adaptative response / methylated-DNA-[protein]-cysteine methyltransferase